MELNNDEKNVIKMLIKRQLGEIENEAALRDVTPAFLAADVKYDDFLKELLKKL